MTAKSISAQIVALFEEDGPDSTAPESRTGEDRILAQTAREYGKGEADLLPKDPGDRHPASRIQKFFLYFIEPEERLAAPSSQTPATKKPDNQPSVPVGRQIRLRFASLRGLGSKILVFFIEPVPEAPAEENLQTGIPNPAELPQELAVVSPPEPELLPATNDAGGTAVTLPAPPSFMQKIRAAFATPEQKEIQTLDFNPGILDTPSLEGSLRDVNITYPIDPPYQYVHIEYSQKDGALIYEVVEPQLSGDEKVALDIVERAFEKLVSTNLEVIEGERRSEYLRERFYSLVNIFGLKLTEQQKERMFFTLKKQYLGYSRIDTLMKDRYIEDISCNGSDIFLYVQHRIYGSTRTNVRFGEVELNNFVLKLAQVGGRHISLLQPIRDVSLPDGSRGNLTLGGEVTKKGSTFTIRKFRANPISPIEMMDYHSVDAMELAYLWILMEYKRSILVSGGTATGKTTFLNVLCSFIPPEYKIVSIEDTAELNLMHPNWIQSITRAGFGSSSGGESVSGVSGVSSKSPGDISLYDLLVAALRQRPEFIIVGEVRGSEAFTLFQAIAVGHAALGTIHAGSMDELLARVESNPMNVPRSLFSNLDVVLFPMHIKKGERSMRRLANIVEMLELDRDTGDLITNTAFKWLPDVDTFQYQGRSFLFDKIRDTHGVSKDLLNQELRDRTDFLLGLQRAGIRDYNAVTEHIRAYYRDKPAVMEQIVSVQTDEMKD